MSARVEKRALAYTTPYTVCYSGPLFLSGVEPRCYLFIAVITNGYSHRFRDTFAVELLKEGVPIESVSVLLGHRSVKVTEKHYAPWVKERQDQLENHVKKGWKLP
ncbi:MAG: hypothetical protein DMG05_20165, partial [Acidobacteria bacterium]